MTEKNDNSSKFLQVPNTSHQNYPNIDKSRKKYEYHKINYKLKNIIQDIINIKSNLVLNKNEIQDQINSNLFVHYLFKSNRIYKEFKLSNENFIDREKSTNTQKIKNEKYLLPNSETKSFIGQKRNLEKEKEEEIDKNKLIYDEIKKKYNEYLNNDKNFPKNIIKIFPNENEYFKMQETIVINDTPFCVVYSDNNYIRKIRAINENKDFYDEKNINFILEYVKSEIEKIIKN